MAENVEQHQIHYDGNNDPYMNINGEMMKLNLTGDYKLGPMTLTDVVRICSNAFKNYFQGQISEIEKFLYDLKVGKTNAIIVAAVTIGLATWLTYLVCYKLFFEESPDKKNESDENEEEKEPIILRDFTIDQLREFDGKNDKPIYIGLMGEVYDVSDAKNYYGVGGSYSCFAGRDCTRAMAKLSFEEAELSNPEITDLGPFERHTLQGWVEKFKYYKNYPIVGKLSYPVQDENRVFTIEELATCNGATGTVSTDRVDLPIYIGLKGFVFDVSYGGKEMYGADGPYGKFAGKDITRALAKMSFNEEDVNSRDISDLTADQQKTLNEWYEKYKNIRKYPVVGKLPPVV